MGIRDIVITELNADPIGKLRDLQLDEQAGERFIALPFEKRLSLQAYTLLVIEDMIALAQHQKQHAPDRRGAASPFTTKVAHAIEERLAGSVHEDITIEAVAKQFNLSRSQCSKSFSKVYGMSPRQYISRLKLNRAKQLLLTAPVTVGEISERLGFRSVNHFSRKPFLKTVPAMDRHVPEPVSPSTDGGFGRRRGGSFQRRTIEAGLDDRRADCLLPCFVLAVRRSAVNRVARPINPFFDGVDHLADP